MKLTDKYIRIKLYTDVQDNVQVIVYRHQRNPDGSRLMEAMNVTQIEWVEYKEGENIPPALVIPKISINFIKAQLPGQPEYQVSTLLQNTIDVPSLLKGENEK